MSIAFGPGSNGAGIDETLGDDGSWVALFDGKTLDGWSVKGGKALYKAEEGMIVGTTVDRSTPVGVVGLSVAWPSGINETEKILHGKSYDRSRLSAYEFQQATRQTGSLRRWYKACAFGISSGTPDTLPSARPP